MWIHNEDGFKRPFYSPDDVQEAYNLIQDLLPTTPQVILKI